MKTLVITNREEYLYTIVSDDREYKVNMEFYGLNEDVCKDNILIVSDELFTSMINDKIINFGSIDSKYGKAKEELKDSDIVILKNGEKTIYLKQVFG